MSARSRTSAAVLVAVALAAGAVSLRADEGFWLFNAVPKGAIKQAYGFDVTDAWLQHVRLASVRFGGASGSFISPDGLVLTNHHVGLSTIAKLSTPERDLVKHGFYARTRADELKAPDLELTVLQSIEDVTDRVNAAVTAGMSQAEAFAARRAAITTIEQESTKATGLKSDVVTLYQGGLYHLYGYKRYTDVRLVFAPEADIAFYGGDPDNFTYPRYDFDVTIFRVYENDRPLKVEHYLRLSPTGTKDGDLVFTSGHPGATQRLYTMAHLEVLRDTSIPATIEMLERRQANLKRYGAAGPEQTRQVGDELFGIENSLKRARGQLGGLKDAKAMATKASAEQALRKAVAGDPKLASEYGTAWADIAGSRKGYAEFGLPYNFIEGGWGFNSRFASLARTIVRLVEEREKPDKDRLAEFTDARRASLERQLFSPAPIYPEAERAKLADSFAFMIAKLGSDHPAVKKALDGKTPEARAAGVVDGCTLKDVAARKALVEGGRAAVAASSDPMIQLVRAFDAEGRALRKRYEDEVVSVERDAYAKIARAVFATKGTSAYPDGTGTLRLSFGAVKGYMEDGKPVAPYTDFAGLYTRQATFEAKPPYDAPQRWDDRKAQLDLATPYNFVSTNDIVGGNSGSPVVNTKGEVVGLIFDGNIQSLPGYFFYDGSVNRAVSVDSRAILEGLRKVYDAAPLVDEILGKTGSSITTGGAR